MEIYKDGSNHLRLCLGPRVQEEQLDLGYSLFFEIISYKLDVLKNADCLRS